MPYFYDQFDGINLPPLNQSQALDPNGMHSALVQSIGGNFDHWGDSVGKADPNALRVSGSYVGEVDYLVDDVGDSLVDDVGDSLIDNEVLASLRSQVSALRQKIRVRGNLWRVRRDDSVREWKTARMTSMAHTITSDSPIAAAEVACVFEAAMAYWHAETITTVSGSAVGSVPLSLFVDNAGETVDDAVITITRTSGTITLVSLTCAELGISWQWTGSLGSGHVLSVDAGAQTVADNTTDAYSGFALGTHTAPGWLTIAPGGHMFTVTVTGGNADVALSYYSQSD